MRDEQALVEQIANSIHLLTGDYASRLWLSKVKRHAKRIIALVREHDRRSMKDELVVGHGRSNVTGGRPIKYVVTNEPNAIEKARAEGAAAERKRIRSAVMAAYIPLVAWVNDTNQLFDGHWYAPRWDCDTLDHILDAIGGDT